MGHLIACRPAQSAVVKDWQSCLRFIGLFNKPFKIGFVCLGSSKYKVPASAVVFVKWDCVMLGSVISGSVIFDCSSGLVREEATFFCYFFF